MHADRLLPAQVAPEGYAALRAVEAYILKSGLPRGMIELVKMRASQINGCAYCLDVHAKDARKHGESEQRLYLLDAWRESPLYSQAERAALAWTEALTNVAATRAPDTDYDELEAHFTDKEITDLTILVGMINLWNRLAIGMRYVHDVS
ncbi:carboxymuconolactone decarboxylase family protein [Bradyrhizobium sp. GCM10027634]|uniref:carboxymuconolactone decarboxylase family protein n=1 Tax=unclassified Bradyrhizobium TaxID=2631580 RepID=UPI00188D7661|nr:MULTISPECIES: carboxymuconolactone decarboxylase family protein [unclassified Bradyrhizobium]MDN5000485.1 carboxymuconolactone decarboxylase family protein [Bradyrhizobium sp. WYCCWR 12677]QOZ42765.1 carboxymuconolactone decarboxylase family protein [Bradyrhizobium sp. CCBAU 53340]